eukprot:gene1986-biopygen13619
MPNGDQVVPQGGHINSTGYHPVPINNVAGLAVDCQTWGMTVLSSTRLDKNFGAGTAMKVWKTTKKYAGYMKGSVIAGVGYRRLRGTPPACRNQCPGQPVKGVPFL